MPKNTLQNTDFIFDESLSFRDKAENVYKFQRLNNPLYHTFSEHFPQPDSESFDPYSIPLLPIRAFKEADVIVQNRKPELLFKSSGTGSSNRSRHLVADADLYRKSIIAEFNRYFDLSSFTILAYTPGYNENRHSSLIWMLNYLISKSESEISQFLPVGEPIDPTLLKQIEDRGETLILFGAAFGLMDVIEMGDADLPAGSLIIETGGMKTHRREMTKEDLRHALAEGFQIPPENIHSEYGMCELLSQCYSIGSEWFKTPSWVDVTIRDPKDSTRICKPGEEGKIGIIDLANIYSCPFILTDDHGVINEDGLFRVLGRWDSAEMRGCNFLIDSD